MKKTAIALGTFDGVHLGHREVLAFAANSGYSSVAVAFRVPPKAFFTKDGIILTQWELKTRLIQETGIEKIDYIDFEEVRDTSPEDFFDWLIKKYNPALIVCGYNYTFGKGGKGDTALLQNLCNKCGVKLKILQKVKVNGEPVCSSRIRSLLKDGKIKEANTLLSLPFSISAPVIHGDGRGKTLFFPTFNQYYPLDKAMVKKGVYLTKAIVDGKEYIGMTNIGNRPTFELDYVVCETNLFDFDGDLYGKELTITLLEFIREEKKFSSADELIAAIQQDKQTILNKLSKR